MKDLPNMGERDCGVPSESPQTTPPTPSLSQPPSASSQSRIRSATTITNSTPQQPAPNDVSRSSGVVAKGSAPEQPPLGWATSWKGAVWDRWRWGILIAFAVIVSRITSL